MPSSGTLLQTSAMFYLVCPELKQFLKYSEVVFDHEERSKK